MLGFVLAQVVGGALGVLLVSALYPNAAATADDVLPFGSDDTLTGSSTTPRSTR